MGIAHTQHFRRPIIHLGVDIVVIITVPRGIGQIVPLTLQMQGHGAADRAGIQQIMTEIKIGFQQRQICTAIAVDLNTLIRGNVLTGFFVQFQDQTIHHFMILFNVGLNHSVKICFGYQITLIQPICHFFGAIQAGFNVDDQRCFF